MMPVEIQYSLESLRKSLVKYGELSGKAEQDVIAKQGEKLNKKIHDGLVLIKPEKGSIRSMAESLLASGRGVRVRPIIYEKMREKYGEDFSSKSQRSSGPNNELAGSGFSARRTMNFQALAVQAEIGLRESGRGFLAYSRPRNTSFAELQASGQAVVEAHDRYSRLLSTVSTDLREDAPVKFARFEWPASSPALEGLSTERQLSILREAIEATNADILIYINRKLEEVKHDSGL